MRYLLSTWLIICCSLLSLVVHGQSLISGRIIDSVSRQPIPFASIKFGETGQGVIASLEGLFDIPSDISGRISWIQVSSLGYETRKVLLPLAGSIALPPSGNALQEVIITPPYDKIRRILNNAIANKSRNNPDKCPWYRCHVYYKTLADVRFLDSVINDTAEEQQREHWEKDMHLTVAETYSIRTWNGPGKLQEDVLASRISGFKYASFTSLVTDFLPFHAYSDYISVNGIDFHNPVSRGYEQYYSFNLADEVLQGQDTVWVFSFLPRGHNANELRGSVYINSSGYAISQIAARANDTALKISTRIEQQYTRVADSSGADRWFPRQLNYIINWQQGTNDRFVLFLKGNSLIDSVSFIPDPGFKFDRSHTIRLAPHAVDQADSILAHIRPTPLDTKELASYHVIDSLGNKIHLDRIVGYFSKLPEGKVPIGKFDILLSRLFSYNDYENVRLGLDAQTNERFIRWLSVGGFAGYGFRDQQWKYGAFAELYLDKHREFVLHGGYTDDLSDPGRIRINRDLDKNYLRSYLLQRVDRLQAWDASIRKRLGYWNLELSGTQQQITPMYAYAFYQHGDYFSTFRAAEASFSFRYAFAERRSPVFGSYYSSGSNYPVWYGKITTGQLDYSSFTTPYTQALSAIAWHKHINRLGFEHILIEGGKSWSNDALPLSKLFAGNGFRYNADIGFSLYAFGGMPSMYPYGYYTDQFINLIIRHDFDRRLYKASIPGTKLSSAPNISIQYALLYGTLANRSAHKLVDFQVPDNAYHEAGIMLNNLLRLQYVNLYYLTLNIGYFYHIVPNAPDLSKNGQPVFGIGIEL